MHYKRTIDQGTGHRDPRLRKYHIFKCAMCSHEKDIDQRPGLNLTLLIKCPNCGVTNDTNNEEALIKRKQQIEQQMEQLTEELNKISTELFIVQGAKSNELLLPQQANLSTT